VPQYHESHWRDVLSERQEEWKNFAVSVGPKAARELYWAPHSFACEDKTVTWEGRFLKCKDADQRPISIQWKFCGWNFSYKFKSEDLLNGEAVSCNHETLKEDEVSAITLNA